MNRTNPTTFAHKVKQTILRHTLVPMDDSQRQPTLVALSGGSDSVALLRVLNELGLPLKAAHCNFCLRGKESERDEQFCRDLCQHLGVELFCKHFDTKDYATRHKLSIEMAARELRYEYFEHLIEQHQLQSIAIAHHKDDQAETLLLNLIRGTGLKGLCGMTHRRGNIIRPLLDVSQEEVFNYLREIQQEFVEDSTNLIADVKRNVVRLKLMPLLKELNPSIIDTLNRDAQHALEAYNILQKLTPLPHLEQRPDGCHTIRKADILSRFALNELLAEHNFSSSQISDIFTQLNDTPGAIYQSPSCQLLRDREHLVLKPKTKTEAPPIHFNPKIPTTHILSTPNSQTLTCTPIPADQLKTIDRRAEVASLDADKVGKGELTLRPVQEGDTFQPLGMKGHKLVSDFLTDLKLDLFQKQAQQVLLNQQNKIIWVVGRRIAHPFRITEQTRNILLLELKT